MIDRLVDASGDDHDTALRPTSLDGFIGQKKGRENLSVFIGAARGRILQHVPRRGGPCRSLV